MSNYNCGFCHKFHDVNFECDAQKNALSMMKKRNDERRKVAMDEGREWPPVDTTRKSWVAHGLKCAVVQGMSLCGYVHVQEGHPDERKHYDDVDVEVHGGLTFRCKDKSGGSWFGFDTAHCTDWWSVGGIEHPGQIWTIDDVAAETERLAEQLSRRRIPCSPSK